MEKKQKKAKNIKWIVLIAIIAVLAGIFLIFYNNTYSLTFDDSGEAITLEYGVDTKLPELTAVCKGNLLHRKGVTVTATGEGEVDFSKLGSYEVTYTASYKGTVVTEKRTVVIADTLPPEITLVSDPEHFTSPIAQYEEEGYTAIDLYDGDLTDRVVREEREGSVYYTATDSHGNTS
ncbi:MAG: immunoglobulin-like domain-containing protein, partial [Lachnospiraceae bacterium]